MFHVFPINTTKKKCRERCTAPGSAQQDSFRHRQTTAQGSKCWHRVCLGLGGACGSGTQGTLWIQWHGTVETQHLLWTRHHSQFRVSNQEVPVQRTMRGGGAGPQGFHRGMMAHFWRRTGVFNLLIHFSNKSL